MKKALVIFGTMLLVSNLFAQNEKKGITQSGIKVVENEARKGWDGTAKGNSLEVYATITGYLAIFPNGLIYDVNLGDGTIEEATPTILNFTTGTPIGGIIVKGGKNPGGQMKIISESDFRGNYTGPKNPKGKGQAFILPDDWNDGNYKIVISINPKDENEEASNKKVKNGGKITGSVVVASGSSFILKKTGTTFEIQQQSIVNTSKNNTKD